MKKTLYLIIFFTIQLSFAQDYSGVVKSYLNQNKAEYRLNQQDISDISISSESFSKSLKAYNVYAEQRYQGIKVFNAISPFLIKNGNVVSAKVSFVDNLTSKVNTTNPTLSPKAAISKAAAALGLGAPTGLTMLQSGIDNTFVFSDGNISLNTIPVQLVYQKMEDSKTLRLAWDLSIYLLDADHYYNVRIDATTGDLLETMDFVSHCNFPDFSPKHSHRTNNKTHFSNNIAKEKNPLADSQYRVFQLPLRNPNDGSDSVVEDPEDATASPFGWHDTNGAAGEEYTITRGNNAYAYLDLCNTSSGDSPDGGASLNFDFPFNLPQSPLNFRDAATVNLFYLNNVMHDVMYQYGFDEASGNFQENNYGNGGSGGDPVNAEAHDGGDINNANFLTPPDGNNGRMQMYLWTGVGAATVLEDLYTINGGTLAGGYGGVPAAFGALIPTNLTGDLVLVEDDDSGTSSDPNDGCDNITNGTALNGKIAVIRRGTCEFGFKALAAENNGAIAVIIVNNVAGDPPLMGAGEVGCQVTIPTFAISNTDGDPIITELGNGTTLNITIDGTNVILKIDGDLDTEIVAHEYGHGISNRLTGGRFNVLCLQNEEQMGDGWSDFFSLIMTMYAGDQGESVRGTGSYASGNPNGIRTYPYSTDFTVNPHTYDDIKAESVPHGVGSVWTAMLWEMTWDLIDEHGFDADIYNGTGGNNIALQLVIDGLKLQPCSPGFVDGRDAILEADMIANGGANRCIIWNAFARRGLGLSASQGSSSSRSDGTEAFDVPADCQLGVGDNKDNNQFIIYPNPSNGEITIKSRLDIGKATISIFDVNGRKVFNRTLTNSSIQSLNISSLRTGFYLIKIDGENYSHTAKLIME